MAMTGPVISSIALIVASRGGRPLRHPVLDVLETTMASSTTMPMASTRPNSVRLFSVKPSTLMTANVPISDTGTAITGRSSRPPVLQEQQDDDGHQDDGVAQRLEHLVDRLADERRGVVDDARSRAPAGSGPSAPPSWPGCRRRCPGRWSRAAGRRAMADRRLAVQRARSGRSSWRPARSRPTSREAA